MYTLNRLERQGEERGRGKNRSDSVGGIMTFLTRVLSKTETAASSLQDKEKHKGYHLTGKDT